MFETTPSIALLFHIVNSTPYFFLFNPILSITKVRSALFLKNAFLPRQFQIRKACMLIDSITWEKLHHTPSVDSFICNMRSSRSRGIKSEAVEDLTAASSLSSYATQDMSELERARLENIRRNEQFLSDLGVVGIKNSMIDEVKKPSKSLKSSRPAKKATMAPQPVRRSSRVTVDKLAAEIRLLKDEGKDEEAAAKQLELDEKVAVQMSGAYVVDAVAASSNESSHQRLAADPIPFTVLQNEDDEGLRQIMATEMSSLFNSADSLNEEAASKKRKVSGGKSSTIGKNGCFMDSSSATFSNLKNTEEDVVKLAPLRMTSVAFHPSDHKIIAAAGDKGGNIGIWDVDYSITNEALSHDGIYRYQPHVSNVSKIFFPEQDYRKMFTASYDGTIRVLDLSKDAFSLAFEAPESIYDTYFSDASFLHNQPDAVYLSKADGTVGLVDFRASSNSYGWCYEVQDCRLTSVEQHPTNEHIIITAGSKDGGVAIHDVRKAGKGWKPINYMTLHSKSINAAYATPDGNHIVSVSQDDTIRTWSNFLGNASSIECSVLRHNNFTGRWLSTFRPAFDPKRANTMVLGSMLQPRRLEIFNIKESTNGKGNKGNSGFELDLICNLSGDYFSSVNSRNCFHPKLELVLGSNSSGKVHLFR